MVIFPFRRGWGGVFDFLDFLLEIVMYGGESGKMPSSDSLTLSWASRASSDSWRRRLNSQSSMSAAVFSAVRARIFSLSSRLRFLLSAVSFSRCWDRFLSSAPCFLLASFSRFYLSTSRFLC